MASEKYLIEDGSKYKQSQIYKFCQSLRRVKSVLVLAVFQMWEKILWEINMYLTRLANG